MDLLPKFDKAVVPPGKISLYLLNASHPDGGPKARFFKAIGFDEAAPGLLEAALLDHLRTGSAVRQERAGRVLWRLRGPLTGLNGRSYMITSVWRWIAESDSLVLVTAFPGRK